MDNNVSPIIYVQGIGLNIAVKIIAEIGDFNNFYSPNKIFSFCRLSPSTYQFGQLSNCYTHMVK